MALCLLLLIIAAAFYVLVDFLLNIETVELFDWLCAIAAIGMAIFLSYVFIQIAPLFNPVRTPYKIAA